MEIKQQGKPQPWERQDGETTSAWQAFVAYRDMGLAEKRSLPMLATKVIGGKRRNLGLLKQWSYRNNWVTRCQLFDNYIDREKQKAVIAERQQMLRRHMNLAKGVQKAVWGPVRELLRRLQDPEEIEAASTGELMKLIDRYASAIEKMVKVERLSAGISTDKVEVENAGGFGVGHPDKEKGFMELVQSDNEALRLWNRLMARLAVVKKERESKEDET